MTTCWSVLIGVGAGAGGGALVGLGLALLRSFGRAPLRTRPTEPVRFPSGSKPGDVIVSVVSRNAATASRDDLDPPDASEDYGW